MELFNQIFNIFTHLDSFLAELVANHGPWTYPFLFIVIFCQTGVVLTPLLPGDSLLFATGMVAALGHLNIHFLVILLIIAAILGNTMNYWIGRYVGPKIFQYEDSRYFNPKYLKKTHHFYERHGGKTIVIGLFLPIIRTYVPFIAGISGMNPWRFTVVMLIGSTLWVSLFLYVSYCFGNIPIVKDNFTLIVLGIVLLSLVPAIIAGIKHHFNR